MNMNLRLIPKGTKDQPRYILATDNQFWTGKTWSDTEKDALLFYSEDDVKLASILSLEGTPRKFVAPVEVQVYGDEPVDLLELQIWLMKAARLFVDYKKINTNNHVLLSIDFSELEEH